MPGIGGEKDKEKVYKTPEWPRPGQMSCAWGLYEPFPFSSNKILRVLYERYKDAEEDADGSHEIRKTDIIFGMDNEWHPLRVIIGDSRPRPISKKGEERQIARQAIKKLTPRERKALGI